MTGWGQPLRPTDPRRLGSYELLGRLGEGGMGIVYLARDPSGRKVAVKIIRAELAHQHEFRSRFRSEVERARDVPPFCTAEVLDADPDHETPYLVVEYVDGPSLAAVVAEHGPLTPANLHGVAIGVATALTAIHGAGVIHRDLKPSNVLLAPGSPKVIDFGIARAAEATDGPTRTDQMVGTVTYMAPERLEPGPRPSVTPAADIFAWGAVVAYAGTGRTPFAADMPHIVAVRIMTAEPDLDGLVEPLRGLVARALAKDPQQRPSAREVLDQLLTMTSQRSAGAAGVLDQQPALREAVAEARAATDVSPPPAIATVPIPPPPTVLQPAPPPTTYIPHQPGRSSGRVMTGVFAGIAVLALLLLTGVVSGKIPLGSAAGSGASSAGPGTSVTPSSSASSDAARPLLVNSLTDRDGEWPSYEEATEKVSCRIDDGLVVEKQKGGTFRCKGSTRQFSDFAATVKVTLHEPTSCAGVWLRISRYAPTGYDAGYLLRICDDATTLLVHGKPKLTSMDELARFPHPDPAQPDRPVTVGVTATGDKLSFTRDGEPLGHWSDTQFASGRFVMGIVGDKSGEPPYRVSFRDLVIKPV